MTCHDGLEILEYRTRGDWIELRTALDGQVAARFEVPQSYRHEEFPSDAAFEAYLMRQTRSLLEQYGDQRHEFR